MSNSTASKPVNSNSEATMSFGADFTAARKKKGMSVENVAQELNILKRHVEAIEAQDFEALPQQAYARGFVLNYAKLVGLNTDEMVEKFEKSYPIHLKQTDVTSPLNPMGTLKRGEQMPIRLNMGLIAGILAAIVFGVILLKMISGTKNEPQNQAQETQIADSLSTSEQAQGAAIGTIATNTNSLPSTSAGSALNPAQATSSQGVLDFWVKSPTTIVVKDSAGNILMSGEQKRGGYQLSGQPPLSLEIDVASQVDVNFNLKPIDLKPYTANNKATLTLQ